MQRRAKTPSSPSGRSFPDIHVQSSHPEPIPENEETSSVDKGPAASARQWLSWLRLEPSEWDILIASTCLKLLLFPA